MWQRIQTIFLVLLIISIVLAYLFPIASGTSEGVVYKLFALHLSTFDDRGQTAVYFPYSITGILIAAAATIAILEIRRYDNRMLQIKLGTLNSLVLMGAMISAVLFITNVPDQYTAQWQNEFGLWILFAGVTFNWLAVRFIRRDEKLVRESDRIR